MQQVTISKDTKISKACSILSSLLMIAAIVLWLIALGQVESDQMSVKSLVMWLMIIIVTAISSVWFGQMAQKNQLEIDLAEYIRQQTDTTGDYDILQDGDDSFNPDFPEEQERKGGTYYGNER